ncbi:hypothetical protein P6F26_03435 [Roseibacterium sp. SDUM158017]|uniref:hypothetical protein n=1 Tax=Roseicyclus salinarum TaxID=3036773 RepID=UPI0024153682|nr:hypothetical protein [Roseibacterium sp. SDUM158017]MDG4647485.1 hypothetical protein [Roseibacterium sp. SDUM158017]
MVSISRKGIGVFGFCLALGLGAGQAAVAATISVVGSATYDAGVPQNNPDLMQEIVKDGMVLSWSFSLDVDTSATGRQPVREIFSRSDASASAGTLTLTNANGSQTFLLGSGSSLIGGTVNLNNPGRYYIDIALPVADIRTPSRLLSFTTRISLRDSVYDFSENPPIAEFLKATDSTTTAFIFGEKDTGAFRPTFFGSSLVLNDGSTAVTSGLTDGVVVPLPSSVVLLGSVLCGLGLVARRRSPHGRA